MRFRFQFRRYRLPFRAVVRTAHGPWIEREGIIIRLEHADGAARAVGFGEAAPISWFGTETVHQVEAECRSLGEWLESPRLQEIPKHLVCLRHAVASAADEVERMSRKEEPKDEGRGSSGERTGSARANEAQTAEGARTADDERAGSVDELTPSSRATLAVAALLPAGPAALMQIAPKGDAGFRVFKWKVGVGDLADELALLDDVCATLPSGGKLRLDANGAWSRRQAERWLERCADRPVEFVEQPIAADARGAEDLLLGLAGDYPTPLALDESLIGDNDVEKWIGAGWSGFFVIKPALVSDLATVLAQLGRANANVVFSSALETAVGAKSALRSAFAWRGGADEAAASKREPRRNRALGFGVWPLFADSRFDGPFSAAFLRFADVERIDAESVWNALS
jgi:o-succinylbenzoate synthase